MTLPAGTNGPNGLAVDPADPRRLYLAAWGVATPGGATGGEILLSTDAGAAWTNVLPQSQHVYDVTLDPKDPSILYASGFDQAAYRSGDRGATWTRLRGFNFKWGHRVLPDLADASKVYVTTFGGSVWHGPATGDPSAVEDVVPALSRVEQLVEANIRGIHAYQVKLARKDGKGDPACWSTRLTDAEIEAWSRSGGALASDPCRPACRRARSTGSGATSNHCSVGARSRTPCPSTSHCVPAAAALVARAPTPRDRQSLPDGARGGADG
jgi:hypothetical protein